MLVSALMRTEKPTKSLQTILETMRASARGQCLAIFDLDSTLYDLTLRVTAILDRFRKDPEMIRRFPIECENLAQAEVRRSDWGIREPLERIGITRGHNPVFMDEVQAAWARGFFSNDFLDRDFPLPGAVRFVEQCLAAKGEVLYLTGRDTARMGEGTELSLRNCGFPFDGVNARLKLKPDTSYDDAQFKADVIADLATRYQYLWLFENEPVNINAVIKRTPSVHIVFVNTCHSGLEEVTGQLATIDFFDGHFEIPISDLE
jgi:hypothetical protein